MDFSKITVKKRDKIEKLFDCVDSVLGDISKNQVDYDIITIKEKWPSVVGDAVAKYAYPIKLEKGTLTVKCKSSVWRQELFSQKSDIINKLNLIQKNVITEFILL